MFEICSAFLDPINAKSCDVIVCFSSVPLHRGRTRGRTGSLALLKCLSDSPGCVCRRTGPPQLCVPSGQHHLLINPLCVKCLFGAELELFGHGCSTFWFLSGPKCSNCCYLLFEPSDSFAGEAADRELSKPPFPCPFLSSSQSLLEHSRS